MLEKPDLPDEKLISCLRDDYGLPVAHIVFLPLGNDVNTAVYQVVADDGTLYFVKLRRGAFDEAIAAIPQFLSECGIRQVIAPIETHAGQLWTHVDAFAVIVSPFVQGRNGFEAPLSAHQWQELGAALKGLHTAVVPPSLGDHIPHEIYSPYWRNLVRMFRARIEDTVFPEPTAAKMVAFLRSRRDEIASIVGRAEALGAALQARSLDQVLCHADIHAGNVLIDGADALYIVDWDTMTFAPKERDLMFIGGGIGGVWQSAEEEALFYRGYGQTEIDPMALAYYRYERIVQDIAAYCEQLLLTEEGGADRERSLGYFLDQFLPNSVVAIADATDAVRRAE
jgi:spectinomycin phosphotransferase